MAQEICQKFIHKQSVTIELRRLIGVERKSFRHNSRAFEPPIGSESAAYFSDN
jgi:hypothetical protein